MGVLYNAGQHGKRQDKDYYADPEMVLPEPRGKIKGQHMLQPSFRCYGTIYEYFRKAVFAALRK
jgi:hypothetical protein